MTKILIVDDEPTVRKTISIVLKTEGYETDLVKSADECWEKIQSLRPDLILLDVRMPGIKPAELVKKIRATPDLKKMKIIYVTAIGTAKAKALHTQAVNGVVEKPFNNKELLDTIKNNLS
jgi:CheY-like chemotaxis protein